MAPKQLTALSGSELVELAAKDHASFKALGAELTRRATNTDAADALIAGHRAAAIPPWLVAYLLGCARTPAGYDTAREILLAAPGQLAESYAGPAMARMKGSASFEDLAHLMMTASHPRSRAGAAYGLQMLEQPGTAAVLLRALQAEKLGHAKAATILATLPDALPSILEWIGSQDVNIEWLALDAAYQRLDKVNDADPRLLAAIRSSLERGGVRLAPRLRQAMLKRVAAA